MLMAMARIGHAHIKAGDVLRLDKPYVDSLAKAARTSVEVVLLQVRPQRRQHGLDICFACHFVHVVLAQVLFDVTFEHFIHEPAHGTSNGRDLLQNGSAFSAFFQCTFQGSRLALDATNTSEEALFCGDCVSHDPIPRFKYTGG
jgi:hypothetical protein